MKTRYAYIHNARMPSEKAHGVYVVKTCEAVSKLGYKSYLLVSSRGENQDSALWTNYGILPKCFEVLRTKTKGMMPIAIIQRIEKFAHPLATCWFAIQALLIASKRKIEIIQTCDPEVVLILFLVNNWYSPTIIFDVHGNLPEWFFYVKKVVAQFLVDAKYFEIILLKHGIEKEKILNLPMGFSPSDYQNLPEKTLAKHSCNIDPKRKVIGYIGRYETLGVEKGIFQMIEVGDKLRKKVPITLLLVGGPENLAKEYSEYAKKLGFEPNEISIIPQVASTEVPKCISACDVGWLVYPDNPRFRNAISPMKVLEYAAANIPIIASNFPSITNQFPTEYLYLVEPGDTDQQAKVIQELLTSQKESIKSKSLHEFIQQYTWIRRQKKILGSLK